MTPEEKEKIDYEIAAKMKAEKEKIDYEILVKMEAEYAKESAKESAKAFKSGCNWLIAIVIIIWLLLNIKFLIAIQNNHA